MTDTRYLELFPVIDAAVKKYLVRAKYIKSIKLKGKDKHSILYRVEWTYEPHKASPIPEYFSASSTGRTLYLELTVPGFHSHSSPTEVSMDLEIALIRPEKVEQKIKDIAKASDSIAAKVVSDIENHVYHYANLQNKVAKLANENPELRKHLVPLLKQAAFKYDSSEPINKPVLVRNLNKIIGNVSKGFFTDEYWRGPQKVWDALNAIGVDWHITSSDYDRKNSPPQSKTWKFEVMFTNPRGKAAKLYGHLVASGAGSVADPLSRYDVVAYVS